MHYIELIFTVAFIIKSVPLLVRAINTEIDYTIYEELPINTYIGTLEADIQINSLQGRKEAKKEYIFYEATSTILELINLDKQSGKLTIRKPIDRETVCPESEKGHLCKLEFTVLVPKDTWINVEIFIQDVNDNPPTFPSKFKYIEISENVPIGYKVLLDVPKDNDAQDSVLENYNLYGKLLTHFSLSILPKPLSLVVISKLDHEKEDYRHFNGTLEVCDNGPKRLCANQFLNIKILDYNDNKPKCVESHYKVRIAEDTEPGTIILTVSATDDDQGAFGNLSYVFLMNRNLKFINKYFSIEKYRGEISLLKQLDVKMSTQIDLIVEVRDGYGYDSHMVQCSVTINIIDKNNHRPDIKIHPVYLLKNNKLTLMENEPIGTTICMLIVTDNDLDENGEVTCKLTMQNDERVALNFATNLKNTRIYSLKSKQIFDRETMEGFAIQVRCTDNGLPSLTSDINLDILLTDDNEFSPKFTNANLTVSLSENSPRDLFILQVKAIDQDADSVLKFQLSRSVRDLFYVNSTSGAIYTKKSFDRETKEKYQFEVFVIDHGVKQQFTGVCLISVIITDQNDNAPSLTNPKSFKIKENEKPYSIVGTLMSIDPDLKENGTVHFQLITITSRYQKINNNTFFIDQVKGTIFTQKKLDREAFFEYKLHILLKDNGTPTLSRIETVTVEIVDVNDNAPKWAFQNSFQKLISITQAQLLSSTDIFTLKVVDEDLDSNCSYFLEVPNKYFLLNHITGQVSSNSQYLPAKIYQITVKACDNGVPKLCSDSLTIDINVSETMATSKSFRIESISKHQLNIILIIVTAIVSCFLCIALIGVSLCIRKRANLSENSSNFNHISDSLYKVDHKIMLGENNDSINDNRLFFPVTGPDLCELCITEPLLQQTSPVVYSTVFSNNYASEIPESLINTISSEVVLSEYDKGNDEHPLNHKFMSLRSDKESYIMWLKNEELRKLEQKSVKFANEKFTVKSTNELNNFDIRQTKL